MLFRLLLRTVQKRKKRVALTGLSVLMGAALLAALLTVTSGVSERVSRELREYGANLTIVPDRAGGAGYIEERDLLKLKRIFWRHNVVGFAPFLSMQAKVGNERVTLVGTWFSRQARLPEGKVVTVGVYDLFPWWKVQGRKITSDADRLSVLVGKELASKLQVSPGSSLRVAYGGMTRTLGVAGILSAGGPEDQRIIADIGVVQEMTGLAGKAEGGKVSAMVVPKSKLPESIRGKEPSRMTPKEYETWYCTPTIEAISTQIKEVVPGAGVKVVRQVAEAEGKLLDKIELLISMIIAVTLVSSTVGVMASMSAAAIERRREIALSKAIGASDGQVALQFFVEAGIIGFIAGLAGFALGIILAEFVGRSVFNVAVPTNPLIFIVTLALSLGMALSGSVLPVRNAARVDPAIALRGE